MMTDMFKQCWVLKFSTELNKKGHLRTKRHHCYLAAASRQCAQPHIFSEELSDNAASATLLPRTWESWWKKFIGALKMIKVLYQYYESVFSFFFSPNI